MGKGRACCGKLRRLWKLKKRRLETKEEAEGRCKKNDNEEERE